MSIGENVKRFRNARKLSQLQLAEAVGVTQPMIAQIERGTKSLTMELGKDIADILKVSVSELLEG